MHSRILVSLDSSLASLQGLDEAVGLAARDGSALRLLHVVDASKHLGRRGCCADLIASMQEAGEQVLEYGRARAQAAGIAAETLLFTTRTTRVADVVAEQARAWGAALIVAGAHDTCRDFGRALQARTPIPVLLVRAAPAVPAVPAGGAGLASAEVRVAVPA